MRVLRRAHSSGEATNHRRLSALLHTHEPVIKEALTPTIAGY